MMRRVFALGRELTLPGVLAAVTVLGAGLARGQDPADRTPGTRAEARDPVRVQAQGGTGETAPEYGTPPPTEPSREARPARARVDAPRRFVSSDTGRVASVNAVSLGNDEATIEIDGRRLVIRPGTRLGDDVVKSISPVRLVLIRSPKPEKPGGEALIVVTFDSEGHGRRQEYWTRDPTAPAAPEVKTP